MMRGRHDAAWRHADRTNLRQHGYRAGTGVRDQGLPLHHNPAREDEHRKGMDIENELLFERSCFAVC